MFYTPIGPFLSVLETTAKLRGPYVEIRLVDSLRTRRRRRFPANRRNPSGRIVPVAIRLRARHEFRQFRKPFAGPETRPISDERVSVSSLWSIPHTPPLRNRCFDRELFDTNPIHVRLNNRRHNLRASVCFFVR